jgi:hypothetical protein
MARLTKMSIAPAKPLRDITTELTLKLYVVQPMLFTVFDSSLNTIACAFCTYQLFFLEIFFIFFLVHLAIFQPAEVWPLTFEAFIVSKFEKTKVFELIVIGIARV